MKILNIVAAAAIGLVAIGAGEPVSHSSHSDSDSVRQGINSNARVFGDGSNTRINTSAVSSTFGGQAEALHDPSGPVAATKRSTAGSTVSIVAKNGPGSAKVAGSASRSTGRLARAGSAFAKASGTFDVAPGMIVRDARGAVIGRVQTVRSTARGTVLSIAMRVGNVTLSLPAANFRGSGNGLVSAMGKAQVNRAARSKSSSRGARQGSLPQR